MRVILFLLLLLPLCGMLFALPPVRNPLTPDQVATYTAQLNGDDVALASEAGRKLAMDQQFDVLLAALQSDNATRRTTAIYSLQYCMTPRVVDALIAVCTQDKEARVRNTALSIIANAYDVKELKDKQPALLAAYKAAANDADGFIARDAVIAIARAVPEDADILLDILANGRTPMARSQAAWMAKALKDPRAYDALVKAAADPDVEVSGRAISALGERKDPRAAPLLLAVLRDDGRHPQQRINAAQALASLAAPEVLDTLLALVKNDNVVLQRYALTALGGYTDPRVGPVMQGAISDRDESMRWTAARILADLKYAPAADALLAQAKKETSTLARREQLRALAALVDPRARELFAAAMIDADRNLQSIGAQGLLALNDDRAFDALTKMLASRSDADTATRLLGNSGNPRAIEPLLQNFQHRREQNPNSGWSGTDDDAIRRLTGGDGSSMTVQSGINRMAPVTIGILPTNTALIDRLFVDAVVTLYNRSNKAVVVLALSPTYHNGEEPLILSGPVAGEVAAIDGGYRFTAKAGTVSAIPLHAGLLLPGQAMQARITYRPVTGNERFLVRYLIADNPYDGTPASLAPLTVFIPNTAQPANDNRTFIPFTDADWRALCKPMPMAIPTGPGAAVRAVVVTTPAGTTPKEEPMMAYPRGAGKGFMGLERAWSAVNRLTGKNARDMALGYSAALGGYVIIDGDDRWLLTNVNQQEKGKALPALPLLFLRDLDAGPVHIRLAPKQQAAAPAGQPLWGKYPVEQGDGGLRVTLDAAALPAFLDAMTANAASLEMTVGTFHARTYVLTF